LARNEIIVSTANVNNARAVALKKEIELIASRPCAETSVDTAASGPDQARSTWRILI
jgi:hypothetical protein